MSVELVVRVRTRHRRDQGDGYSNHVRMSGKAGRPAVLGAADLDRDAIGLTGEPGTGRLQLTSAITFAGDPPPDSVLVSGEVFSAETGETQVGLLLPAVQRFRE